MPGPHRPCAWEVGGEGPAEAEAAGPEGTAAAGTSAPLLHCSQLGELGAGTAPPEPGPSEEEALCPLCQGPEAHPLQERAPHCGVVGGAGLAEGGKCSWRRILRASLANLTRAGSPTEVKSAGIEVPKWHSQIRDNLWTMGERSRTRSSGVEDAAIASEREWTRRLGEGLAMLMETGNRRNETRGQKAMNRNAAEMSNRQRGEKARR